MPTAHHLGMVAHLAPLLSSWFYDDLHDFGIKPSSHLWLAVDAGSPVTSAA